MTALVVRRFLQTIPTLFGVTIIAFLLVRLTGDPVALLLPPEAPQVAVVELRERLGLDRPLHIQYVAFLTGLFQLDFGNSLRYSVPVTQLVGSALPWTLLLVVVSMLFAVIVGVSMGALAAIRRGGVLDTVVRSITLGAQAVPTFYFGIIMILVAGVWLRLVPTVGYASPASLILPTLTLGTYLIPLILRMTRASVLDEINKDYVRSARSVGVGRTRLLALYVGKNAGIPITTVVGLHFGTMFGGSVVTESVFAWPGIGDLLVQSVLQRDFPVVQGIMLFAAFMFIFTNLLVDIGYIILDPRLRRSNAS